MDNYFNNIDYEKHITSDNFMQFYNDPKYSFIRKNDKKELFEQRFRIYVLYPDETINYELSTKYILVGGSYNENYQNGQRRSLSFSIVNENGDFTPNIDTLWVGCKVKFEIGVCFSRYESLWFDKGIFIIQNISPSNSGSERQVTVELADKFSAFSGAAGALAVPYSIPAGSKISEVIQNILLTDMGTGYVIDPKPPIFHSGLADKKTEVDVVCDAGSSYDAIIMDLALQLSAEVYYDASGRLVFVPLNEASLNSNKPLVGEYSADSGGISGLSFNLDYSSIVNKVVVMGNSSNGYPCQGVAENNNPGSPFCTQRIGVRTAPLIHDSNVSTNYLAQELADYELRKYLIAKSSTSATVPFNPLLEVNSLIAISDEFFKLHHVRFIIQSISFSLDYAGDMNVSFSNLENLPFLA